MVAMDFFAASNSYDFFNQYCANLLKNSTVRGLTNAVLADAILIPLHPPIPPINIRKGRGRRKKVRRLVTQKLFTSKRKKEM